MMKPFVFLFLLVHGVSAVTHSLKNVFTGSSQVSHFPEFVVVGLVDDVQTIYCDSNTKRVEPKQAWMNKVTEDDPQYWEGETAACVGYHQSFKDDIEIAKQRLNQTGGVHIAQSMYGCEWDDETDQVKGYHQDGYDGEDFIAFNLETEQFIAPKPEAVITKHKWEHDKVLIAQKKNYLTQICPEWLKKHVNYGRSSLMRKDHPSVSLLQKTPSSPVSCHATGFYPDRAMMFWRKDGEEIHEGVEQGEILPNHDGSFQMNVDLDISSVSPEDWRRYECVFQLSGVEDDIITKLDKTEIRTNWGKNEEVNPPFMIIGIVAVAVILVVVIAVIGFIVYKKKRAQPQPDKTTALEKSSAERLLTVSVNGSDEIVQSDTAQMNGSENSSDH